MLLSISEDAFTRLHRDLQRDLAFVTVESLANQTVAIRTKAIADLYFSSEAYDDYGPEHGTYANHTAIQIPDPRDWEIIEAFAADGMGVEDFDPTDVERIRKMIMITDEEYDGLVADGKIKADELEAERAANQADTDLILDLAHKTTYQLSSGQLRSVYVDRSKNLFDALYDLTDYDGGEPADDLIRLEAEGWHRIVFIGKSALDYIIVPTHRYNDGKVDAEADDIDPA